jgi:predicted transcriptional regulator
VSRPKPAEDTEIVRYRLPKAVIAEIREIADRQCCSMAAVMRQAVTEWIESRKKAI